MNKTPDVKGFAKYVSVGLVNTLIHWSVFLALCFGLGVRQAYSNLVAFSVAATFSFFANARYTFNAKASWVGYLLFVGFMGLLSLGTGHLADVLILPALLTLILFSGISVVCGYFYSKHVIFRGSLS